jgi:hypothetical protein
MFCTKSAEVTYREKWESFRPGGVCWTVLSIVVGVSFVVAPSVCENYTRAPSCPLSHAATPFAPLLHPFAPLLIVIPLAPLSHPFGSVFGRSTLDGSTLVDPPKLVVGGCTLGGSTLG